MQIQISWLLQKPTDLDLHCLQKRTYPGSAGQGLTFTPLWVNSADNKLTIFSLFFPENMLWHFMQTVSSLGDSLHEMSKLFSGKKIKKKIFKNVVCWNVYPAYWVLNLHSKYFLKKNLIFFLENRISCELNHEMIQMKYWALFYGKKKKENIQKNVIHLSTAKFAICMQLLKVQELLFCKGIIAVNKIRHIFQYKRTMMVLYCSD